MSSYKDKKGIQFDTTPGQDNIYLKVAVRSYVLWYVITIYEHE